MAKSDRGFASMPKSRVKEIAAKGGRASGRARRKKKKEERSTTRGKQGFASMTEDEVEQIAKKGGKASSKEDYGPSSNFRQED